MLAHPVMDVVFMLDEKAKSRQRKLTAGVVPKGNHGMSL